MKITSIVLALGAIVASVHAIVPDISSLPGANAVTPLLANIPNAAALAAPAAPVAYKRGVTAETGTPLDEVTKNAGAVASNVVPLGLFGKRGLVPDLKTGTAADSVVQKTAGALPAVVKRGETIAEVKAAAEVYLADVTKAIVTIKADLVAQIVGALKANAHIEITEELLAHINVIVDGIVDGVVRVHIGTLDEIVAKIDAIIKAHLIVGADIKDVIDAILKDISVFVDVQLKVVIETLLKLNLVAEVLASLENLIAIDVLALVKVALSHVVLTITLSVDAVVKVVVAAVANILVTIHIAA